MFNIDIWLGWFVVSIPFLVTVGAIVLALKLPHERHHWKFIWASVFIGLLFSALTFWQQLRASHQSSEDRAQAISQTAKAVSDQDMPYFKSQTELIRDQNVKITQLQKSMPSSSPAAAVIHPRPPVAEPSPVTGRLPNPGYGPNVDEILRLSETRADLIGKYLQKDHQPVGTIKIVTIGVTNPDLADQLQKQFGEIGRWKVQTLSIGTMAIAGFNPGEHLYILSPDMNSSATRTVLGALAAASITAPTHPGMPTIGPMSMGIADVTIVLQ